MEKDPLDVALDINPQLALLQCNTNYGPSYTKCNVYGFVNEHTNYLELELWRWRNIYFTKSISCLYSSGNVYSKLNGFKYCRW